MSRIDAPETVAGEFVAPSAKELLLQRRLSGRGAGMLAPRRVSATHELLPLSFTQEPLWFLEQLESGPATYNIPFARRLRGSIDISALERAINALVERHEPLRTRFVNVDGVPRQQVLPADAIGTVLVSEDLRGLVEAERSDYVAAAVRATATAPFDLTSAPLLRVRLLRVGADEHVLLLTTHHLVGDGWSLRVLLQELGRVYDAAVRGASVSDVLPPLPLQYGDYAAWQREIAQSAALERERGYWLERLAGAPVALELPTDRPRPAVQDHRGDLVSAQIGVDVLHDVRSCARRERCTTFSVLLAAFQVLLSRYSGQTDIVVGSPIAGRTRPEFEPLVGMFVNTLALRTDLGGDPTVRELLARVRETTHGALQNQAIPFEHIVEVMRPQRSLSYSPVFQVLFSHQRHEGVAAESALSIAGLRVEPLVQSEMPAQFDLTLFVDEHPDGIRIAVSYATSLFQRSTIERMLQHYSVLLTALVDNGVAAGERRVSLLPLMDAKERDALLEMSCGAMVAYEPTCLHDMVAAQVARTPSEIAVEHRGATLTYAELDARATHLARLLRANGVHPEARVALCLERSLDLVVAVLAILKAGGAYVPIDPNYPAERLAYVLADANAAVVLTQRSISTAHPALEGSGAVVLCLDTVFHEGDAGDPGALGGIASPGNTAYVLYTSGSTGRPKGVVLTHHNASAMLAWATATFPAAERAVMLASTSLSFDLSVFELFVPLVTGGRVVVLRDAIELAERSAAGGTVADEMGAATFLNTVPSAAAALLRAGTMPVGLRAVGLAGEPLPRELAELLHAWYAGVREPSAPPVLALYNLYGPTEGTTYSTWADVMAAAPAAPGIGRPVANTRAYVLDRAGQLVPRGVPGELFLAGDGVARGYWRRPGLTGERFVPDAFSGRPGARLYRTGDRVRWEPDGTLAYLGRIDFQVKVRGFRIELGEIESVLRAEPNVRDAIVVVRTEEADNPRIVAYVVLTEGETHADVQVVASGLRERVASQVPSYMVPSVVVVLPALPMTPNGKVDRGALPAPAGAGGAGAVGVGVAGPRTATEERVAGIWSAVLGVGVGAVGVGANFFELGGHSLLAMRVVAQVRETVGVEVPVRALFEAPTLGAFAARVAGAVGPVAAGPAAGGAGAGGGGSYPLSYAQERLWFLEQLSPGQATHHIPWARRLAGPVDGRALGAAVQALAARHAVLRSGIASVEGVPQQTVVPVAALGAVLVEETVAPGGMERAVAAAARAPFALGEAPLWRVRLFREAGAAPVLVVTLHHLISDAWSLRRLLGELAELYAAAVAGEALGAAGPAGVTYRDYVRWQRGAGGEAALAGAVAYWRGQLAGAPAVLALPTDRPRPAVQGAAGGVVTGGLTAGEWAGVQGAARALGATPFMVLLAAWQGVLGQYSGQRDVVVGTTVAGRTHAGLEAVQGLFVNTVALRTDVGGDPTGAELVGRVRATALGAYEHAGLPFERLVEVVAPTRSLSHSPVVQVLFELHQGGGEAGEAGERGLFAGSTGVAGATVGLAKYDVTLTTAAVGTGAGATLGAALTYRTELFDAASMARLLADWRRVLSVLVTAPATRLSGIALGSEGDRALVRAAAVGAVVRYAATSLHGLFEEQAAARPGAVAVEWGGATLTYGALDARATALAGELRRAGVGPETRVGLCLTRSFELVVGLLGILKAGGAYVALDPNHPAGRLRAMLVDAGAPVLVTEPAVAAALAAAPGGLPAGLAVVPLVPGGGAEPGAGAGAPGVAVRPDQLAYVYYTSGSTGRPKGVLMPHAGIVNYVAWAAAGYGVSAATVAPVFSSMAVDLTLTNLLPLFHGGRIELVPEGLGPGAGVAALGALADGLAAALLGPEEGYVYGLLKITPTHLALLTEGLEARLAGRVPAEAVAGRLRRIAAVLVVGADSVGAAGVQPWRPDATGAGPVLLDEYGPTETVVGCSVFPVTAGAPTTGVLPIGRPIANLTMYVLAGAGPLVPQPVGVPGELYIGGAGVARGYHRRPGLTADKFVPDPFSAAPGARLYRTGDQARWRADGVLEFLGRRDFQVKLRGYRIEGGEVEGALREHAGVRDALVLVREDRPGDRRLVAYVVATAPGGAPLTAAGLRAHLAPRLPAYMLPQAYVVLPALPLAPSGKVDRHALPAPDPDAEAESDADAAPLTPTETRLASIWTDVLGVKRVGAHDNFFTLGGDSILSGQIAARAHRAGLAVTPRQLFLHQTIATLAAAIDAESDQRSEAAEQGVLTGDVSLLPVQHWFFERTPIDPNHYNQALRVVVSDRVDPDRLANALAQLAVQHDALRLRFSRTAAGPESWTQHYAAPADAPPVFESVGAGDWTAQQFAEHAHATQAGLDIEHGPTIRAVLYDRGPDVPQELLVVAHHLTVDAVSWGILLDDWAELYRHHLDGEAPPLSAKTTSYRQWAVRLQHAADETAMRDEIHHWLRTRESALQLAPGQAIHGTVAEERTMIIDITGADARRVLDAATASGARLDVVLLAACVSACQDALGLQGLRVDMEGHGRNPGGERVDLSRTVGWFTAMHPLAIDVAGIRPGDAAAVLDVVQRSLLETRQAGIGFGALRYLSPDSNTRALLAAYPPADLCFNYLGRADRIVGGEGLFRGSAGVTGPSRSARGQRAYRWEVIASATANAIRVQWSYRDSEGEPTCVERIAASYRAAIADFTTRLTARAGVQAPTGSPGIALTEGDLEELYAELGGNAE